MMFVLFLKTIFFPYIFGQNHLIILIIAEFVQLACFAAIFFSVENFTIKSSLVPLY